MKRVHEGEREVAEKARKYLKFLCMQVTRWRWPMLIQWHHASHRWDATMYVLNWTSIIRVFVFMCVVWFERDQRPTQYAFVCGVLTSFGRTHQIKRQEEKRKTLYGNDHKICTFLIVEDHGYVCVECLLTLHVCLSWARLSCTADCRPFRDTVQFRMCLNTSQTALFNGLFSFAFETWQWCAELGMLKCLTNWQQFIWYMCGTFLAVYAGRTRFALFEYNSQTQTMRLIYSIVFTVDWFKSFVFGTNATERATRDSENQNFIRARTHFLVHVEMQPFHRTHIRTLFALSFSFSFSFGVCL